MEPGFGQSSTPASGSFDKTRVLDVRPLRCLVPMFPSQPGSSTFSPHSSPFVSVSPSGPFPPGFAPFYPFSAPPESQRPPEQSPRTPIAVPNQAGHFGINNPISTAVPITSFRTPPQPSHPSPDATRHPGAANGDAGPPRRSSRNRTVDNQSQSQSAAAEDGYSDSQNQIAQYVSTFSMHVTDTEDTTNVDVQKGKSQKRTRSSQRVNLSSPDVDVDSVVNNLLTTYNLMAIDSFRRADGDKECVGFILMLYDSLRRKISQIEEVKKATPGVTRRPDLRAGTLLMNKGFRTNTNKRVGAVPGVEVGDIFFFRMEMCLVGLHAPSMAGIDYMGVKITQEEEPLAVSIVSSGGYEDNVEDGDVLVYSGQGGNVYGRDKQIEDQKLERGNLALEKSLHRANEVRVIRGLRDVANATGKVYVYDGLYTIQRSWVEKGRSGCSVFKYKLIRVPGQPEAFAMWKSIQQWKEGLTSRVGVILPDLTSGAEYLPVCLVNDVDDEKGPAYFTYFSTLKYSEPFSSLKPSSSCSCQGGCLPGNFNCSCIKRNEGYLPYSANTVLVDNKSLMHECGPACSCPPTCRNRVSQAGLKARLEVFKTKEKGWGLRSWDPIRAGAFICEYAGEVIDNSKMQEVRNKNEDDYIFDATRTYQPLEIMPGDSKGAQKIPFPLIITAKNMGNVARFMNHSCSPTVFWHPVLRGNSSESDLHVVFHAIKHIPPMTELTYDYGIIESSTAEQRKKKCLCGSLKCRGYFY
ncbi:histone-lysine N-methyltransferase, H3 lysine-9 specific SUVH1-like [Malania oleifera]|uniref:histone-lysine N-methyltransferase, H3 lysine-9 specific SUVH1-like n=1 Tax=Malania oleifera TaxID=397392 RepID=UPI0025ADE0A0|nr:histone-lysine N-methyltransferase, H3 lysine-9 specific SUVH1-like [Malania oleifera]